MNSKWILFMEPSKEGFLRQRNKKDFKILFIYPNVMMGALLPINISILSACVKQAGFDADPASWRNHRVGAGPGQFGTG
jgi:hypothetical protein